MTARWIAQTRGAEAARALLVGLGEDVDKAKGGGDVLTPKGFDKILREFSASLDSAVARPEAAAAKRFFEALDVDWSHASKAERGAAVRRAEQAIVKAATEVTPRVQGVLAEKMERIVLATKRTTVDRFELPIRPSLSQVDHEVIEHAVSSQALYVTDEYGNRAAALGDRARSIVAAGLEDGLDRYAIGEHLSTQLGAQLAGRSSAYWEVIASIFSARSRSYGSLSSLEEAEFESFQFDAVLDEVTSVVCRFMHGRIFKVKAAMDRFREVAASESPEAVKDLQPFLSVARDEDGNQAIYFKRGEERVGVAKVVENAEGRKDATGRFSGGMSDGELEAAGVTVPPLHGRCRSLILPI